MTTARRRLQRLVMLGMVLLTVVSCRTPVDTEGPLAVEFFERPGTSLATGPGGDWYVVARRGETPGPFVTVEHDEQIQLFAAESVGERTAAILPLTRVDIGWFNEALEETPRIEFHDDLGGVAVDDTVGLWMGGEEDDVRWMGDAPEGEHRAVVVPADIDLEKSHSLPEHITGLVQADDDGITVRYAAFPEIRGPYLVIPDGPVADFSPRAAATVDAPLIAASWQPDESDDQWFGNYQEGREVSRDTGKPLLVDFTAEWCIRCQEMQTELFGHPRVQRRLREQFVAVRVDYTEETEETTRAVERFDVVGLPRIAFETADGEFLEEVSFSGQMEVGTFVERLDEVTATGGSGIGVGELDGRSGIGTVVGGPVSSSADLHQLAGEHSVELMFAEQNGDTRVGFAADASAPAQGSAPWPVAVAESGFIVDGEANSDVLSTVWHVADDLYRDHPLSAAYHLQRLGLQDTWNVDGNELGTELRHQDLVAAAGYAPWMRSYLVDRQEALGPEIRLYLVRALTYMGRWESVLRYGEETIEGFGGWPEQPGAVGMAHTRRLMAEAHRGLGDDEMAAQSLQRAHDEYLLGGDAYRAALMRRRHLQVTGQQDGYVQVADALEDAGAGYEASRTLLLAAGAAFEQGEHAGGVRFLEHWVDRFADQAPARLLALYRALSDRAGWMAGESVDVNDLVERSDRARQRRWWDAAVVFGLNRRGRGVATDELDTGDWSRLFVEGTRRSDAALFGGEVERALAVSCAELVFADRQVGSGLDEQCQRRLQRWAGEPAGVSAMLDGGFRLLQHGEFSAAERLEDHLLENVPQGMGWAIPRAQTLLFRAARLQQLRVVDDPAGGGEDRREVLETTRQALQMLHDGVGIGELPNLFRTLGDEYAVRGFADQAVSLYDAVRQVAIDTGADGEEFEAALALAVTRYRAGMWKDLESMENVASPLHAARIDLYRAHAHIQRGERSQGEALVKQSLGQARHFGRIQRLSVGHLAAKLADDRGDYRQVRQIVEQQLKAIDELPESVAGRDEALVLEARLRARVVPAVVADEELDADRRVGLAQQHIERARNLLEQVPDSISPRVRQEVLTVAADLTDDHQRYRQLVADLRDLRHGLPKDAPLQTHRELAQSRARLHIENNQVQKAATVVDELFDQGVGLAPTRPRHHCAASTVRYFSGEGRLADYHRDRCAAGESGDRWSGRAMLVAAMAESDASVNYRTELAAHLQQQIPEGAAVRGQRLEWLQAFPRQRVDQDRDYEEHIEEQLTERMAEIALGDADDDDLRRLYEFGEYLIDSAQYERADRFLHDNTRYFFETDRRAEWMVLRGELMVRQLRPFDALDYTERGLEEVEDDAADVRAKLYYLRAVAHHQLGQYFPARDKIERARQLGPDTDRAEKLDELESTLAASRWH